MLTYEDNPDIQKILSKLSRRACHHEVGALFKGTCRQSRAPRVLWCEVCLARDIKKLDRT
jgi:hypothetical protein